jgi:hypothetical protein
MTAETLRALATPKLQHLQADVVVGMNHPARQQIDELVRNRPGTRLYGSLPSLAGLLACADVSVGAGGTTTWERLCLGVPSVVITIADNQELPTRCLAAAGGVRWIGTSTTANVSNIAAGIEQLLADPALGTVEVDGLGALRVAASMIAPAADRLHVERATLAHMGVFLEWRNDALTRQMSFDPEPVPVQDHRRWFEGKLCNPRSDLLTTSTTQRSFRMPSSQSFADSGWAVSWCGRRSMLPAACLPVGFEHVFAAKMSRAGVFSPVSAGRSRCRVRT